MNMKPVWRTKPKKSEPCTRTQEEFGRNITLLVNLDAKTIFMVS